ncbi:TetR/AcrR family transcriptional regulator [Aquabacter cavernae]|uniref:TetR/AcrR family transcriptional regulator n=1 Tax=Aquabacter cavernae TaxID=2496029 RepID=UPI0013E01D76|nr:TetR/AcrR family transcriptional regulator [Aquabacter cavernae]
MAGRRQFDEEQVLGAAERLFRAQGYGATSMLDLSRATGVQRGSLYNAFGDKEHVFLKTFARYRTRFLEAAETALATPDLRAGLSAFLRIAVANMTAGPARGCLSTRLATEGAGAGAKVCEEVRELLDALDALLLSAFSRPGTGCALPPDHAARLVVAFTRGLAVMERVHGDAGQLQAMGDDLVALLFPNPPA